MKFLFACGCVALLVQSASADDSTFAIDVEPFIRKYCLRCHGEKQPQADFSLHGLSKLVRGKNLSRFEKALEMVSIGDMPPKKADQPPAKARQRFISWVTLELRKLGRGPAASRAAFPKFANRLDHDALFSGKHKGPAYTPARVWRINSQIYSQLVEDLNLRRDYVPPLNAVAGEGFRDYAMLYADEAAIRTMMQNGKRVAMNIVHGELVTPRGAALRKNIKPRRKDSRHRILANFARLKMPTREQMKEAVRYTYQLLLNRRPTNDEVDRQIARNLLPNVKAGGADAGLRGFLVSMLLSPEFLFRMELGLGKALPDGRRMLSSHELAYAISYAFYDHPVKSLLAAADRGKLQSRQDVEREVRSLLDARKLLRGRIPVARRDGKAFWPVAKNGLRNWGTSSVALSRVLRFFREYFDYAKATDVFKDDFRHGKSHDPRQIVRDADWFVLSILAKDKQVLEKLLTSNEFPIRYFNGKKAKRVGYGVVYNLKEGGWPTDRAVSLPRNQRAGILTHPAWLVAHSGNFETDPVRRGKWIQERLLAGVVPDIPIGVEAQLPDAPHKTLRQRFSIVREQKCWRCHKKMNPLGEPFEIFDDFGRHRSQHHVTAQGHVLASDLEINRNRRNLKAKPGRAVNAAGELIGTGDDKLDGKVTDAIDLVQRLAKSRRVRQSFLRHVFRFWMGRNETLNDSPTLIAMEKAYVSSGGSFKETLVALLTSDSFLYRK